nr:F-box/kelch-repeat protein At3g23880-like [Ipomoea batatas]
MTTGSTCPSFPYRSREISNIKTTLHLRSLKWLSSTDSYVSEESTRKSCATFARGKSRKLTMRLHGRLSECAGENTPHGLSAGIVYPNIGVHVNGTLNWSSSKMVGRDDWESKIVSFHLTTNSAVILSGPKPGRSRKHFHMRRWRRRLCLSDDEDDEDQEQRQ